MTHHLKPALLVLLALPAFALAQGSLTPSAAPGPTMKTLTQVEPRTPLQAGAPGVTANSNGGFTITASGSFYLTGNITVASGDGIRIAAENVSLDLGGFTIASKNPTSPGTGVDATGYANIAVRNGFIRGGVVFSGGVFSGSGFVNGVYLPYGLASSAEDICVRGVSGDGITGARVRNCSVAACGNFGINGTTVCDSTAEDCGLIGIHGSTIADCRAWITSATAAIYSTGTVSNSVGINSGTGAGVYALNAGNCHGESVGGTGLYAVTVNNCSGRSTSGIAIDGARVSSSYAESGSGTAIRCKAANDCTAISNGGPSAMIAEAQAENCLVSLYSADSTGFANALAAENASNCRAKASGTGSITAIRATIATGCIGTAQNGTGIWAKNATNCRGETGDGTGLSAWSATGCAGNSSSGTGLLASVALNCMGESTSGIGLLAEQTATNCFGKSSTGSAGINIATGTANSCSGYRSGGVAIKAKIAIGCNVYGIGTIDAEQKFLGTP